jgi:DNA-binding MarR family transcriptional regulator
VAYARKSLHFIYIPASIAARGDITWNEKAVLGVIAYLIKKTGNTRAHNSYIAEQIGLQTHAVDNIISRLRHKGFLWSHIYKNVYGKVWKRDFIIHYPISSTEE